MAQEGKLNRRSQLFLIPSFQIRYVAQLILVAAFVMASVFIANKLFFESFLDLGREFAFSEKHPYMVLLSKQQERMSLFFLVWSLVVFIALTIYGLYSSHRIAGPVYKITRFFDEYKPDQSSQPVTLREKDFFKELAASINRALITRGRSDQ